MVFKYWANYRLNYVDTSIPGKVLEAIERIKEYIAKNEHQISIWEQTTRNRPDETPVISSQINLAKQENERLTQALSDLESILIKQPGSED